LWRELVLYHQKTTLGGKKGAYSLFQNKGPGSERKKENGYYPDTKEEWPYFWKKRYSQEIGENNLLLVHSKEFGRRGSESRLEGKSLSYGKKKRLGEKKLASLKE